MVGSNFEVILQDVGRELGIPLRADQYESCQIDLKEGVKVQMEIYRRTNQFLICYHLGSPPPGKYRENLLREALKANGLPAPRHGVFGFSEKTEQFYLFELLPKDNLDGKKVAERLLAMKDKAVTWATAIANGDTPHVVSSATSGGSQGVFGIRG